MASQGGAPRRSLSVTTASLHGKKKSMDIGERGPDTGRRSFTVSRSPLGLTGGERTVKRLRLSKALTVPATTTIYEACKRMASRRVDALLLTDSNEMLCGILTDKTTKQRCFNTNCPGFVLVNSQIPLGLVFKVSKPDAVTENRFYISRDKASGNWWLTLGKDIKIGFWPIQTLVGLGDSATDIFWGGEIISVPNSKSCPMGNGQTMTGPYPKLYAYARGVSVLDENKGTLVSIDHRNDLVSDIGLSYVLQSLDGWGKTVFFGGPPSVFGK